MVLKLYIEYINARNSISTSISNANRNSLFWNSINRVCIQSYISRVSIRVQWHNLEKEDSSNFQNAKTESIWYCRLAFGILDYWKLKRDVRLLGFLG